MSKSMMTPSLKKRSFKSDSLRKSFENNYNPKRKDSEKISIIPKIQSLANDMSMEFSVPRNPNKKKEFSFENKNSEEIIIADNFSFSEKLHENLKRVKRGSSNFDTHQMSKSSNQKTSPGVFGSICSSIMNRYNSFIQVNSIYF